MKLINSIATPINRLLKLQIKPPSRPFKNKTKILVNFRGKSLLSQLRKNYITISSTTLLKRSSPVSGGRGRRGAGSNGRGARPRRRICRYQTRQYLNGIAFGNVIARANTPDPVCPTRKRERACARAPPTPTSERDGGAGTDGERE